jgi:uncharacterized protein YaeQ
MALKATIFKAELQVSDLDRHYYAAHALMLARHPSETDERMMVRLLAFALHADPDLAFTRGLSSDDEPDLWRHDPDGTLALWIETGLPDERRLRQACGRAGQVVVITYGGRAAELWWGRNGETLNRHANLSVVNVAAETSAMLTGLAKRNMRLDCTIDDGMAWLSDGDSSVEVVPEVWK